jgi:Mrp family chromosome partitioning ATPase
MSTDSLERPHHDTAVLLARGGPDDELPITLLNAALELRSDGHGLAAKGVDRVRRQLEDGLIDADEAERRLNRLLDLATGRRRPLSTTWGNGEHHERQQ